MLPPGQGSRPTTRALPAPSWNARATCHVSATRAARCVRVSIGRTAEGGHHFIHAVGRGVRNGDAETDAGAHRFFAIFDRIDDGFAAGWIDVFGFNQMID